MLDTKSDCIQTDMAELVITGSPVTEEEIMTLRALFPKTRVYQCYSLASAGGFVTMFDVRNDTAYLHNNPACCGKLMKGFWCKVRSAPTSSNTFSC